MNIRYDMVMCFVVRPAGASWEFLQLRRAAGEYLAGMWQTVAGRIEPGETAWQTALRELNEETGLVPDELYSLDRISSFYVYGDDTLWHGPIFCAIVNFQAPVRLDAEHDDFRWIPREAARTSFLWPSDQESVMQVCTIILDNGPAKAYMRIC